MAALAAALMLVGCKKDADAADGGADTTSDAAIVVVPPAVPTVMVPPIATTHTPPVTNEADAVAVRACCSSLRSAGSSKTGTDKTKYDSAAAACDGIAELVHRGTTGRAAAMGQVRAAFHGTALPPGCN